MRMPNARCLLVLPTLMLLQSCGKPAPDYFPLDRGRSWDYRIEHQNLRHSHREQLQIEALGPVLLGEESLQLRRTSQGTRYWLRVDAEGVRRVASQSVVDSAPVLDAVPRTVLPADLRAGVEWNASSRPYVLERHYPYRERFYADAAYQFDLRYRLEAVGQAVDVPAGHFDDCLRVLATGELLVHADPRLGPSKVPVEQREWYCAGVGLVRLERVETLDVEQVSGGRLLMELHTFER